jgi:hypothetical protein
MLVLAAASFVFNSYATPFADSVVSYDPGTGYAVRFTHAPAVLGEPSRVNPFSDSVEPFNPPYSTNQIVSLGEGGSLVVQFHQPIINHPNNLFGLDFIIFGNTGFIITNEFDLMTYNWIGVPATDGSLFGQNLGSTLVSVSRDGVHFYVLDPMLAPVVDNLFPTDGAGNFQIPLDPAVTPEEFSGRTLDDMRALYNGSGGGTAFDISWARDVDGDPVFLPEINFVRIDVLSGKSEIDAFVAVERESHAPHASDHR